MNSPLINEVNDGQCFKVAKEEDQEAQIQETKEKDQASAEKVKTS